MYPQNNRGSFTDTKYNTRRDVFPHLGFQQPVVAPFWRPPKNLGGAAFARVFKHNVSTQRTATKLGTPALDHQGSSRAQSRGTWTTLDRKEHKLETKRRNERYSPCLESIAVPGTFLRVHTIQGGAVPVVLLAHLLISGTREGRRKEPAVQRSSTREHRQKEDTDRSKHDIQRTDPQRKRRTAL